MIIFPIHFFILKNSTVSHDLLKKKRLKIMHDLIIDDSTVLLLKSDQKVYLLGTGMQMKSLWKLFKILSNVKNIV